MIGEAWFASRGWTPFAFQREVWAAMAAGRSGLLHATTGAGKTYAVWFGAIERAIAVGAALPRVAAGASESSQTRAPPLGVRLLRIGDRLDDLLDGIVLLSLAT